MVTKLQQGAKNAINKCLQVKPEDKVVIISDNYTEEVGKALKKHAKKATENVLYLVIEDFVKRPATDLPEDLISVIKGFGPTVSIYAAQGQTGELPVFRGPLVDVLKDELNCRHAHMISISKELMEDGMNKDYDLVSKVSTKLHDLLQKTTQILVTDPHGTDVMFDIDSKTRNWIAFQSSISHGEMRNLPGGEVFTCPTNANGTFIGWVLGDNLSEKYGKLDKPLCVTISDGYIRSTVCEIPEVKKDFDTYIKEYEFGNRIGELGIGTLIGLEKFVGNLLQDEKFPGVHIAFGDSYPSETNADWDCPSHIDIIARDVNITLKTSEGDIEIMKNGEYLDFMLE